MSGEDRARPVRGFTLVEILIVIGIIGALAALVAPVGLRQVESARAREEEAMVRGSIEFWVSDAFISGRRARITADGRSLSVSFQERGKSELKLDLNHLFFTPGRVIEVNSNGVASPSTLEFVASGRRGQIDLNRWQSR
jgi:prepilin-type N-terminal cleavage/methylation domain-containing protein